MINPAIVTGCRAARSPRNVPVMNAAINGIVVIMRPARLLAVVLSASVMRYQGPTISNAANNSTPANFSASLEDLRGK